MPRAAERQGMSSLHICMMGLVLMNLVFVYLTEVASTTSLLPLFVLTLAAPLLARFKENKLYRALWNVGVVGVFALLVSHVMERDLAYVLEDGLILALLCQVHLLNNLHDQQRPDLLFINSYLIALITGYITVDMGFAGAFLVYAPFYVVGLQFLSASRPGKPMAAEDSKAVLWDGAKRSAVMIGAALLVFLVWPRDFERTALLEKYITFDPSQSRAEVAFSETVDLKKRSGTSGNREVVMTATLLSGESSGVPSLWRGATLQLKGRGSWGMGDSGGSADAPWEPTANGLAMGRSFAAAGEAAKVRVVRKSAGTKRLFLPEGARQVALDSVHQRGKLLPMADGTASYSNAGELRYELDIARADATVPGPTLSRDDRRRYLQHRESLSLKSCIGLADSLVKRLPGTPTPRELTEDFTSYLARRYSYRFPGEEGAAGTLHEFLTTEAGGHCEFFASALAIMLRSKGVPSRVVTGYRADRWEEGALEVTNLDAHAWVEAYLEGEGWVTLDPTPAMDMATHGPGLFARFGEAAQGFWNRVTGFDGEARAEAMAWLRAAPSRMWRAAADRPWSSATLVSALIGAMAVLRGYRRRRTPASVRQLQKAMAKAGVTQRTGETPREVLERVRAALPVDAVGEVGVLQDLEAATTLHERERYGTGQV